jgi:3-oxoacyl-(acyl-carrier-protein) synthase
LTIVREMLNAAATAISMEFGITGPSLTVSTACASGAHAIGEAYRMIKFGVAEHALCGGSDTLPSHTQFSCWQQLRVLSDVPCQPLAAERKGISLGEGSGILVLEEMENARARGAHIYAELAGFGMGSDAADWVNPNPKGMLRCMREALHDAGIAPADLSYINAHATGTFRGDAAEAEALQILLENNHVPISSTKALHGHAMGASGALEAIATILALSGGWLPGMPATAPDPGINLSLVWQETDEPAAIRSTAALSNSFGFGGVNAALVFRRAESVHGKEMQ